MNVLTDSPILQVQPPAKGGKICPLGEPRIGWLIHFRMFVPQVTFRNLLTVFVMNCIGQSQEKELVDLCQPGCPVGLLGSSSQVGGYPDSGASPEAASDLQSTKQAKDGQEQQRTLESVLCCSQ